MEAISAEPPPENARSDRNASTVDDFCARNAIGRSTFYKEVKEGRLKLRKVGRKTVVLREDEESWRDALPVLQTAEAA